MTIHLTYYPFFSCIWNRIEIKNQSRHDSIFFFFFSFLFFLITESFEALITYTDLGGNGIKTGLYVWHFPFMHCLDKTMDE